MLSWIDGNPYEIAAVLILFIIYCLAKFGKK